MASLTLLVLPAPSTQALRPWRPHLRDAAAYAAARAGTVSFGVRTRHGLRGLAVDRTVPSASVVKAMLLVDYLRRSELRDRSLRPSHAYWNETLRGVAARMLRGLRPGSRPGDG